MQKLLVNRLKKNYILNILFLSFLTSRHYAKAFISVKLNVQPDVNYTNRLSDDDFDHVYHIFNCKYDFTKRLGVFHLNRLIIVHINPNIINSS